MTPASQTEAVQVMVVPGRARMGTIAGVLSCVFGVLGIFAFPLIFVPIALICALVGFVAATFSRNGRALGASFLGVLLSMGAAVKSPTIWVMLGLWALFSPHPANKVSVRPGQNIVVAASPSVGSARPEVPTSPGDAGAVNSPPVRPDGADAVDQAVAAAQRFNVKTAGNMSNLSRIEARMRELSNEFEPEAGRSSTLSIQEGRTLLNNLGQARAETDRAHEGVISAKATFETVSADRLRLVEANLAACQRQDLASFAGCKALLVEATVFKQNVADFAAKFDALEATYQQARQVQQDLANGVPRATGTQ